MKSQTFTLTTTASIQNVGQVPVKIFCRILLQLEQQQLLKCRLLSKEINQLIVSHFIFSTVLNDRNVSRNWKSGIQLPWKRKGYQGVQRQSKVQLNAIRRLIVGKLLAINFSCKISSVATIKEIEFTEPITRRNMRRILKECWACSILRMHTSVFLGTSMVKNYCCAKRNNYSLAHTIEIDTNQLEKLFVILDKATMTDSSPCTVPYLLKVNFHYPVDSKLYDSCEIHFITPDVDESSLKIFKTWVVNDKIIDLYSRPDCLRKLTYFARVLEAELRTIKIKFVPDLSIPSTVRCASVIHQPAFYPQLKKYPTGPFNGTVLTYFSTKRKQIKTYRPVHISSDVLFMTFPEAAMLLVSEISPNKT